MICRPPTKKLIGAADLGSTQPSSIAPLMNSTAPTNSSPTDPIARPFLGVQVVALPGPLDGRPRRGRWDQARDTGTPCPGSTCCGPFALGRTSMSKIAVGM